MMSEKPKVVIYTDGGAAPNPGLGGWGAVLMFTDETGNTAEKEIYGAQPNATNNIMELTAVIEALKSLKTSCRVTLYADSEYVVKGMNEWMAGWKRNNWKNSKKEVVRNKELWQTLDEEAQRHHVTFKWVKAHVGIKHNERVDGLVHKARDEYRLSH